MGSMPADELAKTARALVVPGKGILAADESFPTIKRRFEAIKVESTEETRRAYRELLFTTNGIEEFISGVIMFDETLRLASLAQGKPSAKILEEKGIIPGIKVDKGKVEFPGSPKEFLTKGLEGLGKRLRGYKKLGAQFTKWRVVIVIGDGLPSSEAINENAKVLAEYAHTSQESGLVPVVEPEVLRDGSHDIRRCEEVSRLSLESVFRQLKKNKVYLGGMLLKPNMVTPGKDGSKASVEEVAKKTLEVMGEIVPKQVPGIVFLSGGQSPQEATAHLNAMNKRGKAPWDVGFSFARALQKPVLEAWRGKKENKDRAQKAFLRRARLASAARYGEYTPEMEKEKDA